MNQYIYWERLDKLSYSLEKRGSYLFYWPYSYIWKIQGMGAMLKSLHNNELVVMHSEQKGLIKVQSLKRGMTILCTKIIIDDGLTVIYLPLARIESSILHTKQLWEKVSYLYYFFTYPRQVSKLYYYQIARNTSGCVWNKLRTIDRLHINEGWSNLALIKFPDAR